MRSIDEKNCGVLVASWHVEASRPQVLSGRIAAWDVGDAIIVTKMVAKNMSDLDILRVKSTGYT